MFSALKSCAQTTRTAFASVLYSSAPGNMNTGLISCFPAGGSDGEHTGIVLCRFRRSAGGGYRETVSQCNNVYSLVWVHVWNASITRLHDSCIELLISARAGDWMQFIRSSFASVWCAKQAQFWHETDEWINISYCCSGEISQLEAHLPTTNLLGLYVKYGVF